MKVGSKSSDMMRIIIYIFSLFTMIANGEKIRVLRSTLLLEDYLKEGTMSGAKYIHNNQVTIMAL